MKTRTLGKTGYAVSEIGLGCWQLGGEFGPVSEDQGRDILKAASEADITFFDTADVYGDGRSERLVGEHAGSLPERPVVATKVGRSPDLYPDGYGSADAIADHLKQSADRLRTDTLDLVQLHCVPPRELERGAIFETMNRLQQDGLCRFWGASVETLDEARTCLSEPGCASLQLIFNIFRQDAADEVLPRAHEGDVGIIVRLPLASGLLTGKFTKSFSFDESDHRNFNREGEAFSVGETFSGLPFERGVTLAETVRSMLPEGPSMAQSALRWILDHPAVSSVIAGASKPEQARSNAAASTLEPLTPETHEALRRLYDEEVRELIKVPV